MKSIFLILIFNLGAKVFAQQTPVYETSEDIVVIVEKERELRWVPSVGLGSLKLQSGDQDSNVDKNLDPQLSAEIQLLWEVPLSHPQISFEWGFGFLGLGSKLVASPGSELRLAYFNVPLGVRFNLQNELKSTQLFVRATVNPALLASASVDACRSAFCGFDNDVDDYFRESRSVKNDFNEYQTFASIGLGFEVTLFKNVLIDSLGIIGDVAYTQTMSKVNKTNAFGKDMRISGLAARLGLVIDL